VTDEVRLIPRSAIAPGDNHRKHFDEEELRELAASLSSCGVLQNLVVRPVGEGYSIVAGERRWRAAALAGIDELPCRVVQLTEAEAYRFSLTENLQRAQVSPLEEADGYSVLRDRFGLTADEIAREVSKSQSYIQARLSLTNLGNNCRDLLTEGLLAVGQAQEIARVLDPADQFKLAKLAIERQMTKSQTAQLVRAFLEGAGEKAVQVKLFEVEGPTEEEQEHWNNKFLKNLAHVAKTLHDGWDMKCQQIARKMLASGLRGDVENIRNLQKWLGDIAEILEQEIARKALEKEGE